MRYLLLLLMVAVGSAQADSQPRFYTSEATRAANLPFSDGVWVE